MEERIMEREDLDDDRQIRKEQQQLVNRQQGEIPISDTGFEDPRALQQWGTCRQETKQERWHQQHEDVGIQGEEGGALIQQRIYEQEEEREEGDDGRLHTGEDEEGVKLHLWLQQKQEKQEDWQEKGDAESGSAENGYTRGRQICTSASVVVHTVTADSDDDKESFAAGAHGLISRASRLLAALNEARCAQDILRGEQHQRQGLNGSQQPRHTQSSRKQNSKAFAQHRQQGLKESRRLQTTQQSNPIKDPPNNAVAGVQPSAVSVFRVPALPIRLPSQQEHTVDASQKVAGIAGATETPSLSSNLVSTSTVYLSSMSDSFAVDLSPPTGEDPPVDPCAIVSTGVDDVAQVNECQKAMDGCSARSDEMGEGNTVTTSAAVVLHRGRTSQQLTRRQQRSHKRQRGTHSVCGSCEKWSSSNNGDSNSSDSNNKGINGVQSQKNQDTKQRENHLELRRLTDEAVTLLQELSGALEAATEALVTAEEKRSVHQRRAETLQAKLEKAINDVDSANAEAEQLSKELQDACDELLVLRRRCAMLEETPPLRSNTYLELAGEYEPCRRRLSRAPSASVLLQLHEYAELRESEEAYAAAAQQQQTLQRRVSDLAAANHRKTQQNDDLQQELRRLRKNLREKEEELTDTTESGRSGSSCCAGLCQCSTGCSSARLLPPPPDSAAPLCHAAFVCSMDSEGNSAREQAAARFPETRAAAAASARQSYMSTAAAAVSAVPMPAAASPPASREEAVTTRKKASKATKDGAGESGAKRHSRTTAVGAGGREDGCEATIAHEHGINSESGDRVLEERVATWVEPRREPEGLAVFGEEGDEEEAAETAAETAAGGAAKAYENGATVYGREFDEQTAARAAGEGDIRKSHQQQMTASRRTPQRRPACVPPLDLQGALPCKMSPVGLRGRLVNVAATNDTDCAGQQKTTAQNTTAQNTAEWGGTLLPCAASHLARSFNESSGTGGDVSRRQSHTHNSSSRSNTHHERTRRRRRKRRSSNRNVSVRRATRDRINATHSSSGDRVLSLGSSRSSSRNAAEEGRNCKSDTVFSSSDDSTRSHVNASRSSCVNSGHTLVRSGDHVTDAGKEDDSTGSRERHSGDDAPHTELNDTHSSSDNGTLLAKTDGVVVVHDHCNSSGSGTSTTKRVGRSEGRTTTFATSRSRTSMQRRTACNAARSNSRSVSGCLSRKRRGSSPSQLRRENAEDFHVNTTSTGDTYHNNFLRECSSYKKSTNNSRTYTNKGTEGADVFSASESSNCCNGAELAQHERRGKGGISSRICNRGHTETVGFGRSQYVKKTSYNMNNPCDSTGKHPTTIFYSTRRRRRRGRKSSNSSSTKAIELETSCTVSSPCNATRTGDTTNFPGRRSSSSSCTSSSSSSSSARKSIAPRRRRRSSSSSSSNSGSSNSSKGTGAMLCYGKASDGGKKNGKPANYVSIHSNDGGASTDEFLIRSVHTSSRILYNSGSTATLHNVPFTTSSRHRESSSSVFAVPAANEVCVIESGKNNNVNRTADIERVAMFEIAQNTTEKGQDASLGLRQSSERNPKSHRKEMQAPATAAVSCARAPSAPETGVFENESLTSMWHTAAADVCCPTPRGQALLHIFQKQRLQRRGQQHQRQWVQGQQQQRDLWQQHMPQHVRIPSEQRNSHGTRMTAEALLQSAKEPQPQQHQQHRLQHQLEELCTKERYPQQNAKLLRQLSKRRVLLNVVSNAAAAENVNAVHATTTSQDARPTILSTASTSCGNSEDPSCCGISAIADAQSPQPYKNTFPAAVVPSGSMTPSVSGVATSAFDRHFCVYSDTTALPTHPLNEDGGLLPGRSRDEKGEKHLSMFDELLQSALLQKPLREEEAELKLSLERVLLAVAATSIPLNELQKKGVSSECLRTIAEVRKQHGEKQQQKANNQGQRDKQAKQQLEQQSMKLQHKAQQQQQTKEALPHQKLPTQLNNVQSEQQQSLAVSACGNASSSSTNSIDNKGGSRTTFRTYRQVPVDSTSVHIEQAGILNGVTKLLSPSAKWILWRDILPPRLLSVVSLALACSIPRSSSAAETSSVCISVTSGSSDGDSSRDNNSGRSRRKLSHCGSKYLDSKYQIPGHLYDKGSHQSRTSTIQWERKMKLDGGEPDDIIYALPCLWWWWGSKRALAVRRLLQKAECISGSSVYTIGRTASSNLEAASAETTIATRGTGECGGGRAKAEEAAIEVEEVRNARREEKEDVYERREETHTAMEIVAAQKEEDTANTAAAAAVDATLLAEAAALAEELQEELLMEMKQNKSDKHNEDSLEDRVEGREVNSGEHCTVTATGGVIGDASPSNETCTARQYRGPLAAGAALCGRELRTTTPEQRESSAAVLLVKDDILGPKQVPQQWQPQHTAAQRKAAGQQHQDIAVECRPPQRQQRIATEQRQQQREEKATEEQQQQGTPAKQQQQQQERAAEQHHQEKAPEQQQQAKSAEQQQHRQKTAAEQQKITAEQQQQRAAAWRRQSEAKKEILVSAVSCETASAEQMQVARPHQFLNTRLLLLGVATVGALALMSIKKRAMHESE